MGTTAPVLSNVLCCGTLLLVVSLGHCRIEKPVLTSEFLRNVNDTIDNRTVIPYCFIVESLDLTCFWESNTSNISAFTMNYVIDKRKEITCNLTTLKASEESWWLVCQIPSDDVSCFGDPSEISLRDNQSNTTHRQMLRMERVVWVPPLGNITVEEQKLPLGLLVSFKNPDEDPNLKYSLMYQVDYTSPKGRKSKIFSQVYVQNDTVKLSLEGIIRGAKYTISVRAKAEEPYDGYWSPWVVTTFQASNGFDEYHIVFFVFAGLVPVFGVSLLAVYQRRFLKRKMWPDVPSPEHHFKELYTTHKGNFKTWLGQTDSYLTWISRNIFHEGPITTLEVLSELPNAPPSFLPPVPLPPKDSYVALDENVLPPFLGMWMVSPRYEQRAQPCPVDDENAIRREVRAPEVEARPTEPEEFGQLTAVEEPATDATEIMTLKGPPRSRTTLREDSLSSEEGKHSTGSSFEYTVLETCDGLLSPRTRSIPPRQPLKYAYLLMSESGEESPPPSPNIYQNSPCGQLPAPVYSQC